MSYEDVLGLLIGIGALAVVLGYLADVCFHPRRFQWLELPRSGVGNNAAVPPLSRRIGSPVRAWGRDGGGVRSAIEPRP